MSADAAGHLDLGTAPGQATARPMLPELGFYGLAGHAAAPRDLLAEIGDAERLGLGSVFLSERFNLKDAATLSGAAGAASTRLGIATAATNHNTRHPLVTATMAATMHRLTDGRFTLGLGRGFGMLFDVMGLPRVTSAQMTDAIELYRRLWRGEAVLDHDGPAGRYPFLSQDPALGEAVPVLLTAIGERTLELAGAIADAVVLHTFFADETVARSVAAVRRGAEQAGRDPAEVRVWSVMATVTNELDEELRLKKLVGRLATYLQGYGDLLVRVNGWDPDALARFRADDLVDGYPGALDAVATREELEHVAGLLPDEWLAASATGSPADCAARITDQLDAGADSVILHGATPTELASVVEAWRQRRPAGLDALAANPGRIRP